MTCPSCSADIPAGARFCPSCGHAVVARPDERRVATVLFADLVGFTSYAEGTDPEHVKGLVDRCFERLVGDVAAFGGQVDKIVGDAIVALFGAPIAHEDDAERAVRAGLRMQQTLATLREASGLAVEMRIGINTGEVLVGALRAGGDYTAMGDVVNTASRLQAVAQPGQVVVGGPTHLATSTGVRYEPLGPIAVKGRGEPVDAWVAVEAVAPPGARRVSARTPLIGRDSELAVLRAALDTAVQRDRAHLVLLTGEAGVGKSRLASELGNLAACEHDAHVITGHCIPYGEANVWWPVAAALQHACGVEPNDTPDAAATKVRASVAATLGLLEDSPELARVTDGLLYLFGRGGPGDDVDPARARDDARRAAGAYLEGLMRTHPVVMLISDLHWAEDALLELLERLLERLRAHPFVLVATTRPELEERWSPRAGRHNTMLVNLDPLDAVDADALAEHLLGQAATPELVAVLRERSGGNPFFLEELATMMADGGARRARELPATLHGLVAARLDMLSPSERNALEDAAVVGTSGATSLVVAMAEELGHPITGDLARLARQELLVIEDGDYTFRNELVREVAYGTLAKAERARRHGAIVHLLALRAEQDDGLDEHLDQLAHHFGTTANLIAELGPIPGLPEDFVAQGARFLERAAERAEQRENWPMVIRYVGYALKVVARDDDPRQALALRLGRARANTELRETVAAREDVAVARELAERLGDTAGDAAALTVLGDIEFREGNLDGSAATLRDAIEAWRALDEPAGLADALRRAGMTDVFRSELDGAEALTEEALTTFRAVGDRRGEAWALQNRAWIAFLRGNLPMAEARINESVDAFGDIGDWGGVSWALGLLGWVRYSQGRVEEAERLAVQSAAEANEVGNRWGAAMMQVLLASLALWRGDDEQAIAEATEARAAFRALGDPWGETQSLAPRILALNSLGRMTEADHALDELWAVATNTASLARVPALMHISVAGRRGEPGLLDLVERVPEVNPGELGGIEIEWTRALAQLQAGRAAAGLTHAEAAFAGTEQRGERAAAGVVYAMVLVGAGRVHEALAVADEIEPLVVTYVDRYRLALARAFAHHACGEIAAAEEQLDRAIEVVDATQSRLDQLVVRIARSALWHAEGRADATVADADTRLRAEALGIEPAGWESAFASLAAARAGTVETA